MLSPNVAFELAALNLWCSSFFTWSDFLTENRLPLSGQCSWSLNCA
jgi:hypothetical protein